MGVDAVLYLERLPRWALKVITVQTHMGLHPLPMCLSLSLCLVCLCLSPQHMYLHV